jgi:hypothetical protein
MLSVVMCTNAKVKTALEKNKWGQNQYQNQALTIKNCKCLIFHGEAPGSRTPDLLIKSEEKE